MFRPATAARPYAPLLVATLAFVAGLQLLRSSLSGLSVYLGQVRDLSPTLLAFLIFAIFLAAFAAPLVRRMLGDQRAFLGLAAMLALLRLAEQYTSDLDARLAIALAGVICWLWFMPFSLARHSADDHAENGPPPGLALMLGLTVDTAIKGAFLTLDLSAAPGLPPQLTTIALTLAQLGLVRSLARTRARPFNDAGPHGFALAVGPIIALHLLIFQNLAHSAAVIGWPLPAVFAWTTFANVIAIAALLVNPVGATKPLLWLWPVVVLVGIVVPLQPQPAWHAAIATLLGPAATAVALHGALTRNRLGRFARLGLPLGMFGIPLLLFGWYANYEIALPISQVGMIWIAALIVAVFGPTLGSEVSRTVWRHRYAALGALCLLFALPLAQVLTWNVPEPAGSSDRLTVMTYNIHQGFDLHGRHDLEGIAQAIEDAQPQIVALQEVPRGWVVNGSVDALGWLAQRLRMHAAWGPAADPNWGNAILSRYPIIDVSNRPMPNNDDLRFDRAYIVATIDLGDRQVQVVATHLHHIERESHHRFPQVRALLEHVDWSRPTILLGDLNAQPHHEELGLLISAGLSTVQPPVPTYPSNRPRWQLDYVLTTSHFELIDVFAPQTTASDHLPLLATLE